MKEFSEATWPQEENQGAGVGQDWQKQGYVQTCLGWKQRVESLASPKEGGTIKAAKLHFPFSRALS